jgi:hypothetical protein
MVGAWRWLALVACAGVLFGAAAAAATDASSERVYKRADRQLRKLDREETRIAASLRRARTPAQLQRRVHRLLRKGRAIRRALRRAREAVLREEPSSPTGRTARSLAVRSLRTGLTSSREFDRYVKAAYNGRRKSSARHKRRWLSAAKQFRRLRRRALDAFQRARRESEPTPVPPLAAPTELSSTQLG